jgi:hypothetical protein
MVSVVTNLSEIAAAAKLLDPAIHRAVVRNAVKQTVKDGKGMVVDEVQSQTTAIKKYITRAIKTRVTSNDPPVGEIVVTRQPLPLIAFKTTASKSGITATISQGRTPIVFKHAFKTRVASAAQAAQGVSRLGIFERARGKGKGGFASRLPIKQLMGPPITSIVNVPKISDEITDALAAKMTENYMAELNEALKETQK